MTSREGAISAEKAEESVRAGTYASVLALALGAVLIAALDFATGTRGNPHYILSVLLRCLYLVPILCAAFWFGLEGGVVGALAASGLSFLPLLVTGAGRAAGDASQVAFIAVYLMAGFVMGTLASVEGRMRRTKQEAGRQAQRDLLLNCLERLSHALKWRDEFSHVHSEHVAGLCVNMSARLGLAPARAETLRLAARVHDIGKIGIRDDVLLKHGSLTQEERASIEKHPGVAADMLRTIEGADQIEAIVLAHHERLDGSGYPRGLAGDDITMEMRILAVADVYCALTEDRPYHSGRKAQEALLWMREELSTKLDAQVMDVLEAAVRSAGGLAAP